jgi:superfamily II DNA or RNA helicase
MSSSMETALTRIGYRIPLTKENEERCKKDLVLAPKENKFVDYGVKISPIHNYRKSSKFIYVPHSYGIVTYGNPSKNFLNKNVKKINLEFKGKLRETQETIVRATEKTFETENKGGLISASTGIGKTFFALFMIAKLGLKTLIIVNKELLKRQWIKEIKKVLPTARIGTIQSDVKDVEDKDIVIGMLQSISKRNYNPKIFDEFGLTVIDEVHGIASKYFSKVLFKIQTQYKLGLSATICRKDGMEEIFKQHLGEIIITLNNLTVEPVIQFINIRDLEPNIKQHKDRRGNTNMAKLITDISKSKKRNQLIVREVLKMLTKNRKLIVFSDRVAQCKLLNHVTLQTIGKYEQLNYSSSIFIGGMKDVDYEHAKTCDVIFATYSLCKEGFDHPILDCCILATPKSDVLQICGRILRQKNPNEPLVIDLVDRNFSTFNGMYNRRRRYYKSNNWKILPNLELDEEIKSNESVMLENCVIIEEE